AAICLIAYGVQEGEGDRGSSDNLYLAVALIAVVVVTGCFGYYQEFKSTNIIASFRNLVPQVSAPGTPGHTWGHLGIHLGEAGGTWDTPRHTWDTPGGTATGLVISTGDRTVIGRIASLASGSHLGHTWVTPRHTWVIPGGTATGLVISTGDRTVIGRIASLASGVENERTPIAVEIEHFVDIIAGLAVLFGATFFVVAMIIGYPFLRALVFFMAIVVAYVPEGLLATVTV
ncbi:ATP4A ATPase, partial [Leucopsar rothschildi]|nr:ATP4A ATPase [Leucopsar rothschildi]